MKPVQHTGDSTGGPEKKIDKPMDRPFPSYTNNESNPPDDFHEEPLDEGLMENHGDLSKRFGRRG